MRYSNPKKLKFIPMGGDHHALTLIDPRYALYRSRGLLEYSETIRKMRRDRTGFVGMQEKDVQRSTVSPRWKAKELTAPTILPQNVLLDWEAGYPAQHDEAKYELAEIEGSVPMLLRNGTLFRNGPGKFGETSPPRLAS
jgi:hypothetical protein